MKTRGGANFLVAGTARSYAFSEIRLPVPDPSRRLPLVDRRRCFLPGSDLFCTQSAPIEAISLDRRLDLVAYSDSAFLLPPPPCLLDYRGRLPSRDHQ